MPLLTAHELARELKVTVDTVWRYTRKGKIPSIRLGPREYRYCLEEVMAALNGQTQEAKAKDTGSTRPKTGLKPSDPKLLYTFAGEVFQEAEVEDGR